LGDILTSGTPVAASRGSEGASAPRGPASTPTESANPMQPLCVLMNLAECVARVSIMMAAIPVCQSGAYCDQYVLGQRRGLLGQDLAEAILGRLSGAGLHADTNRTSTYTGLGPPLSACSAPDRVRQAAAALGQETHVAPMSCGTATGRKHMMSAQAPRARCVLLPWMLILRRRQASAGIHATNAIIGRTIRICRVWLTSRCSCGGLVWL